MRIEREVSGAPAVASRCLANPDDPCFVPAFELKEDLNHASAVPRTYG